MISNVLKNQNQTIRFRVTMNVFQHDGKRSRGNRFVHFSFDVRPFESRCVLSSVQCTATCSSQSGFRHRRVLCYHHGSVVRDEYCQQQSKPAEHEWCSTNVSCSAWSMGEWTPVSRSDGASVWIDRFSSFFSVL